MQYVGYSGSSLTKSNFQMDVRGQGCSVAGHVLSVCSAINCLPCAVFPSISAGLLKAGILPLGLYQILRVRFKGGVFAEAMLGRPWTRLD